MRKQKNGKKIFTAKEENEKLYNMVCHTDKTLIVFDVETTGLSSKKDFIIQISGVKYKYDGKFYEKIETLDQYINPIIPIPEKIVQITGITNDFIKDKPKEQEVFNKIKEFFNIEDENTILIGYNVNFDIGFLLGLYLRQTGLIHNIPEHRIIDVMKLARELLIKEELENNSYKLCNVAKLFDITSDHFHSAIEDVLVTYDTMIQLLKLYMTQYKAEYMEIKNRKIIFTPTQLYKMKKSKFCNNLIISGYYVLNNNRINCQIHYNYFDKYYVEDKGDAFTLCNLYTLHKQLKEQKEIK